MHATYHRCFYLAVANTIPTVCHLYEYMQNVCIVVCSPLFIAIPVFGPVVYRKYIRIPLYDVYKT